MTQNPTPDQSKGSSSRKPRKQGPVTVYPGKKMADYQPGPRWWPKWLRKAYAKVTSSMEGVLKGGGGGGPTGAPPAKKDRFTPLGEGMRGGKNVKTTTRVTPTAPGSGVTIQGQRRPAMAGTARPHGSTPVTSLFGESVPGYLRAGSGLADRTRGVGESLGSLAAAFSAHAEAGPSLGLKGAALGSWADHADRLRQFAAQLGDVADGAGDTSLAEHRELAPAVEALGSAPLTARPSVGAIRGAESDTTPRPEGRVAVDPVSGPESDAAPAIEAPTETAPEPAAATGGE